MGEKTKRLGNPENTETVIGPVVDKAQFDRVINIIDTAKTENQGTLLMGGKASGTKVFCSFVITFLGCYRPKHILTSIAGILH